MRTARGIGRVGSLAIALGVGTSIWIGCATASADTGSTDPAGSIASAPDRRPVHARPAPAAKHPSTGKQIAKALSVGSDSPLAAASTAIRVSLSVGDLDTRSTALARSRRVSRATDATADPVAARRSVPASVIGAFRTPTAPIARMASVLIAQTSTVNPDALPPKPALQEIWIAVGSSLANLAQTAFRALSIAAYLGPTASTLNQTLVVNGYNLVPSSTERVTSFYGQWAFWPGGPTLIQGQQQYTVVDPVTKQSMGTFDALVSTGSPFNVRGKYVELLVTANDGVNVGTEAGQVPPVGSLIATFDFFAGFGWSYSAMPTASKSVITFKLLSPFFDIPIPFGFDASKGIADHTVDNRPVNLGNGYSIVPADPNGETYVGTSGFLPYYTAVQAHEIFNIRDSSGVTVGSFEGDVTPTSDVLGVYTQAILVTRVTGGTAGTAPGDVPPVGSVFNVMYRGIDTDYVVYSSLPSSSGNVVSLIAVNGSKVSNIRTFPMNLLDASAPPPVKRLPIAGGYSLLPVSPLLPSGVNGLPPREVQIQGYQQFGVYDSAGVQCGSFDADVFTQWDMYGNYSQALLVTKVTDGTAGTTPGDVPPVGSLINYVYVGNSGFGTYYSSMPSGSGAKVSFKFLTPLIDIPTWSTYNASAGMSGVAFFNPFAGP